MILSPIEQSIKAKIEKAGTPLKDWDINIYRGVLTGFNDAFIISEEKRQEILNNCKSKDERERTAELIRPILRGRDIKRYSYEYADLWLIYIPWHFPLHFDKTIQGASEKAEREFQKQYPAVYSHLLQYKEPLSKRNKAETGIRYEWYAMQRWGANYMDEFNKPKIVWSETMRIHKHSDERFPRFSFDYNGFKTDKTCFFATGRNLEWVTCILNSYIGQYLCSKYVSILDNGGYLMQKIFIEKIPILNIHPELEKLCKLQIKNPSIRQENNIDQELYKLYGLSKGEIDFIEHLN